MQLLPGVTPVEPAFVERLEKDQDGSRPHHLLRVDQLLAAAELAGGDEVLHPRHHHRDHRPGLRDAGDLGHHADLHDLRLDLPEAGRGWLCRPAPSGIRIPAGRMNGLTMSPDPQRELLHPPVHAGPDDGLRQLHLGLGQGGFGAGLLGRQERGDLDLGGLLGGGGCGNRALAAVTTFWSRSISRTATMAALRRFSSCFVSSSSTAC